MAVCTVASYTSLANAENKVVEEKIQVRNDVFEKFHNIQQKTSYDANGLLEHFFRSYSSLVLGTASISVREEVADQFKMIQRLTHLDSNSLLEQFIQLFSSDIQTSHPKAVKVKTEPIEAPEESGTLDSNPNQISTSQQESSIVTPAQPEAPEVSSPPTLDLLVQSQDENAGADQPTEEGSEPSTVEEFAENPDSDSDSDTIDMETDIAETGPPPALQRSNSGHVVLETPDFEIRTSDDMDDNAEPDSPPGLNNNMGPVMNDKEALSNLYVNTVDSTEGCAQISAPGSTVVTPVKLHKVVKADDEGSEHSLVEEEVFGSSAPRQPPRKKLKSTAVQRGDRHDNPSEAVDRAKHKHRKSGIDNNWILSFPWLKVTDKGKGMLCSICVKHQCRPKKFGKNPINPTCIWVDVPCKRLQRDALVRHNDAVSHKEACTRDAALQLSNRGQEEIKVCGSSLLSSMKMMYFLCKEELPFHTMFKQLLCVVESLGVDVPLSLDVRGRDQSTSERVLQDMVVVLGETIWEPLRRDIVKSPFFSVVVDMTRDISDAKQLMVYVRFLKDRKNMTVFAHLVDIVNDKAETIRAGVSQFLADNQLPVNKMCALTTGTDIRWGMGPSVGSLLQQDVAHLLLNPSATDRLYMAGNQTAASVHYLKRFQNTIKHLYRFYHRKPAVTDTLKEIQAVVDKRQNKGNKGTGIGWLFDEAAIQAVRCCLTPIVSDLEREAQDWDDPEAQGLVSFMLRYEFVATLYLMCDVVPVMAALYRAIKAREMGFTGVGKLVTGTVDTVRALRNCPGEHFRSLPSFVSSTKISVQQPTDAMMKQFQSDVYMKFCEELAANLETCFRDLTILEAFSVFNTSEWPNDVEELASYGTDSIQCLARHFKSLVIEENVVTEFNLFKSVVVTSPTLMKAVVQQVLGEAAVAMTDMFPSLAQLAAIGLLLLPPATEHEAETGGFETLFQEGSGSQPALLGNEEPLAFPLLLDAAVSSTEGVESGEATPATQEAEAVPLLPLEPPAVPSEAPEPQTTEQNVQAAQPQEAEPKPSENPEVPDVVKAQEPSVVPFQLEISERSVEFLQAHSQNSKQSSKESTPSEPVPQTSKQSESEPEVVIDIDVDAVASSSTASDTSKKDEKKGKNEPEVVIDVEEYEKNPSRYRSPQAQIRPRMPSPRFSYSPRGQWRGGPGMGIRPQAIPMQYRNSTGSMRSPYMAAYQNQNQRSLSTSSAAPFTSPGARPKCPYCTFVAEKPLYLKEHIQRQHSNLLQTAQTAQQKLTCKMCQQQFPSRFEFNKHVQQHHIKPKFYCHVCQQQFQSQADLIRHYNEAHQQRSFSCTECNQQFTSQPEFVNHIKECHPKQKFTCHICNRQYSTKSALRIHIQEKHMDEKKYTCKVCSQQFTTRHLWQVHLDTHEELRQFQCGACNKTFIYPTNKAKHEATCPARKAQAPGPAPDNTNTVTNIT